jgi:hypothetical protein
MRATAAINPQVLRFGLPTKYGPLLVIPAVTTALTAGMLVVAVLACVRRYWTVLGRALFSMVTLAAVVMVGLFAYWGLLTWVF